MVNERRRDRTQRGGAERERERSGRVGIDVGWSLQVYRAAEAKAGHEGKRGPGIEAHFDDLLLQVPSVVDISFLFGQSNLLRTIARGWQPVYWWGAVGSAEGRRWIGRVIVRPARFQVLAARDRRY